jgi:FlaG/FlaF family flagellin (archaellin)
MKLFYYLVLVILLINNIVDAQVPRSVNVYPPGTFSSMLTTTELKTITDLTVTGSIDARDIFVMRDSMSVLANLNLSNVSISEYGVYKYFELPSYSFHKKASLEKVTLPRVYYIRENAFAGCANLSGELIIPTSIMYIAGNAFSNCKKLTGNLNLSKLNSLGYGAFSGCSGLTGLIIPSTMGIIGDDAFHNCTGLSGSLTFPDRLIEIGKHAFQGCANITSLNLSKNLKWIGQYAFYNCNSIQGSLIIPDGMNTISRYSFANCSSLDGTLTLPDSINSIEEHAFNGCSAFIGKLEIPDLLQSIGSYAFANCHSFSELKLSGSLTKIPEGCFQNCFGLTGTLQFSDKITEIGKNSFENCSGFTSLRLSSSISTILNRAFKNCSGLSGELDIPINVKSIGSGAFEGCSGFTNLSLSNSINLISDSTFRNCTNLTGVLKIPSSVVSIGKNAFENCNKFTEIEFPKSVKTIMHNAFLNCTGFKGILSIPSSVTWIEHGAFEGCSGFTELTFKASVMDTGKRTFKNCSGLTGVLDLPNSIKIIGDEAFRNCKNLNAVVLPSSVSQIGNSSFEGCENLKFINLYKRYPSDIYFDGENAFNGVNKDSCYLYVPRGSKELYSNSSHWKEFRNIIDGVISTVATRPVTDVNTILPKGNAEIINFDAGNPTICGFVWDSLPSFSILNASKVSRTIQSSGNYSLTLADLSPNTTYYVRSFITNENGTNYGDEVTFKTLNPQIELLGIDSLVEFTALGGSTSSSQFFWVSGTNLGAVLTISSPNGFEIRRDGTNNFSKVISVNPVKGTVDSIKIEIRLTSLNTYGNIAGHIICSSIWADEKLLFVKGNITRKLLSITFPEVVKNKMYDGKIDAKVNSVGTLSGYNSSDAYSLSVTATAYYDNADVGINKKITVKYLLSGLAKDKYEAPSDHVFYDGKISDFVTLSSVNVLDKSICSGDSLYLQYSVSTGIPTHFKIVFDPELFYSGLFSSGYTPIQDGNAAVLSTYISKFAKDGSYAGNLVLKNELSVESPRYPFTFTINVSSNYIDTKFGDVLIFDNSEKRFSGYQWFKNGVELIGETKQFYFDREGLNGDYSVVLKTVTGETKYSCTKRFENSVSAKSVNYPNPVNQNESFVVSLSDWNLTDMDKSVISVYNLKGECVYYNKEVLNENSLIINEAGFYIIKIDLEQRVFISKIIVK